jgi:hypothetical protein
LEAGPANGLQERQDRNNPTKHARDVRILMQPMISGAALAIANQMGNAGLPIFALILIVAGVGYAALDVQKGH